MIVEMLTESDGRLSFVTTVSRSSKSRLKSQYFQPLTLLHVECELRRQAQLQKLREVRLLAPFTTIPFDAVKLSVTLFLAEFLCHATRGEQRNQPLFDYVTSSLSWLDGYDGTVANFHLVFMMRLTRFIGFFPNTEDYREGDVFDLRTASFASSVPLHTDFLVPADAARIRTLMRMNYESMHLFRMSHEERNRIVDVLLRYYQLHVPGFPELRSLEVVRELWT